MPLSDIVNVQISTQTQAVPQMSFGLPMILGTSKSFLDLIRQYSDLSGVAADFTPQQPEYIAAASIFSQKQSPTSIFIGRRNADSATLNIVSGQANAQWTTTVNGSTATVSSSEIAQTITAALSGPLVSGNLTNVVFNNAVLGTITSVITYSAVFGTDNTITTTINGVTLLPAVSWTTDQATTIEAVRAQIAAATGVASATTLGLTITVVFTSPGQNTVTSSIASGTAAPTTTIREGGFLYATSSAATLELIRAAIQAAGNNTSIVSGNSIIITGTTGSTNVLNTFSVAGGVPPTTTITVSSYRNAVATLMATKINGLGQPVNAVAAPSPEGNYTITATSTGVPYTLKTSSTIVTPNNAYVAITNVVPVASYTLTLNGTQYTYTTTDAIQTAQFIAAQLITAINANTTNSGLVATDNADGSFYVKASSSAVTFSIFGSPELFAILTGVRVLPLVATDAIATTLTNIRNVNSNWYGLILTDRTKATVEAAMDWAENNKPVLFATASDDLTIINSPVGTDVSSVAWYAQNKGYIRSFVLYHQDASIDYPEAAWMGFVFTMDPGSETWKFKTLQGVANSSLTTNQSNNALNKNANTYQNVGNVNITMNGTTGQGEFIDIIRGVDWLTNLIQTNVFSVLVNQPKVPYTDAGIAVIESQVFKSLQQGIANNFLSDNPAPIVTVPLAANVPTIDKTQRILRNVNFQATLAGAIHAVFIRGTVSV